LVKSEMTPTGISQRAIIAFLIFLAKPAHGLDPSWTAVLGEAQAHDWVFGRDIIFTRGPLSALYTHWFDADSIWRHLALSGFLAAAFALLVSALALQTGRRAHGVIAALGPMLFVWTLPEAIFMLFPLLVSYLILLPERGRLQMIAVMMGLLSCALATLVTFLMAPLAILSFVLLDCISAKRRRCCRFTLASTVTLVCEFCLA